jgi:hypothetical protein
MHSQHLPILAFLIFFIPFVVVFLIMLRSLKFIRLSKQDPEAAKAEIEKIMAAASLDGKPGFNASIIVKTTGLGGTTTNSYQVGDLNSNPLVKKIVNLAENAVESELNAQKIKQVKDINSENAIVDNKGEKGILD